MKEYYSIKQRGREADIYIFGDIELYQWIESDVTAYSIAKQIGDIDADVINVHIDSYGGYISEGWAIYNALRNHPAKIKTYGDGFVASAALYPFLAGDERYASSVSAYFMHNGITSASGNAEDLRSAADVVETMTEIGKQAFIDRAGMDEETVTALMDAETWLTPEMALEYNIATAIVADKAPTYAQSVKKSIMQKLIQPVKQAEKPKEPETAVETLKEKLGSFFND